MSVRKAVLFNAVNNIEHKKNISVAFLYLELCNTLFSQLKTEIDVVNVDDAQTLNWLLTYETFRLASYLETG